MSSEALLALQRAAVLFVPAGISLALALARPPSPRERAGLVVALGWCFPAVLALDGAARALGWWHGDARGGLLLETPVDLWLGWTAAWGLTLNLALPRARLGTVLVLAAVFDFWTMPLLSPLVRLGESWLFGEVAALVLVLAPARLLYRWTALHRRLAPRATLLALASGGLMLGVLPAAILSWSGRDLLVGPTPSAQDIFLAAQLLFLPALLGLSAAQEFAQRGGGTALPLDPPERLVTSGPYAYLRNPMQLGAALLLLACAWLLESAALGAAAVSVVLFAAGFAAWHEEQQLRARFGQDWSRYRLAVPAWRPRFRPWLAAPATLYYGAGCSMCEDLVRWLKMLGPQGLLLIPAQSYAGEVPRRLRYEASGHRASGVAALGRALEHVHLGWALVGMGLRLPPICWFLQLLADASGAGPRRLPPLDAGDAGPSANLPRMPRPYPMTGQGVTRDG